MNVRILAQAFTIRGLNNILAGALVGLVVFLGVRALSRRIPNYLNGTAFATYTEQFLTPDLDTYGWERKGEYPETISWTPEGILVDPPSGSTAYVSMRVAGTRGVLGAIPPAVRGPLGRLFQPNTYEITAINVDINVALQNAYFMVIEWGATTVQATAGGFLVTIVQPGLVHANTLVPADTTQVHSIHVTKANGTSCVVLLEKHICSDSIPHSNDKEIWVGQSRKNHEQGGTLLIKNVTTSLSYY